MKTLRSIAPFVLLAVAGPLFAASVDGCGGAKPPTVPQVVSIALDIEQVACALAQREAGVKDPAIVVDLCAIPPAEIQTVANLFARTAAKSAELRAAKGAK